MPGNLQNGCSGERATHEDAQKFATRRMVELAFHVIVHVSMQVSVMVAVAALAHEISC